MVGPSVWYTLRTPGCAPAQRLYPVQGSGATRFHGIFRPAVDGLPAHWLQSIIGCFLELSPLRHCIRRMQCFPSYHVLLQIA